MLWSALVPLNENVSDVPDDAPTTTVLRVAPTIVATIARMFSRTVALAASVTNTVAAFGADVVVEGAGVVDGAAEVVTSWVVEIRRCL